MPKTIDFPADDYEAALASSESMPLYPDELEDTRTSTEGAASWIVGFVLIVLGCCAGWWAAMTWGV